MMSTTLGALRTGFHGATYAGGFRCDRCRGEFAMNSDRVVHCGSCEVDFCDGCAAQMASNLECDSGHPLVPKYAADLAGEDPRYSSSSSSSSGGRFTCNCCGTTSTSFPVRHCSVCSFDMCPDCVRTRLGFTGGGGDGDGDGAIAHHHPPPLHMLGDVVEVPVPPAMNSEWRGIFRDAGISETSLTIEPNRSAILNAIRGMIPARSRPLLIDFLPPVEDLPMTTQEISAALRAAVGRSGPRTPRTPAGPIWDPPVHLD